MTKDLLVGIDLVTKHNFRHSIIGFGSPAPVLSRAETSSKNAVMSEINGVGYPATYFRWVKTSDPLSPVFLCLGTDGSFTLMFLCDLQVRAATGALPVGCVRVGERADGRQSARHPHRRQAPGLLGPDAGKSLRHSPDTHPVGTTTERV